MDNPFAVVLNPDSTTADLLAASRQHQEDWVKHGVNRVQLYFEDVEGDWLEKFGEDEDESLN